MKTSRWVLLVGCLSAMPPLFADALSELPPAWAQRLAPLPKQAFGDMDPGSAERLRDTRAQLSGSLIEGAAQPKDLAPAYGRLGALYAAQRLSAAAEIAFENARRLDPDEFRWVYYGAHLALDAGDAEQALQRLQQAEALDGRYPTLGLRTGEALLGLNRLDAAERAYAVALERYPEQRAAALYGLAQIDLLQRRWQEAADRLSEVLQLQPAADAAHYGLGQALLRLDRREQAKQHLAQRGARKPGYPDELVAELASLQSGARHSFEQAMIAADRQDYERAITAFAEGLEQEPDNHRARTSYARALWIEGRTQEAIEQLRLAAREDRTETLAGFLLAVIADSEGRTDEAIEGYREVLERDPGHLGTLSYLGNLELSRGHAKPAAESFRRAIEIDTGQPSLRLHYWRALFESGASQSELLDALERFDQRFPEPPMFRLLLARLLATSPDAQVRDTGRALQLAADLINTMPIAPHQELLALALAARGEWQQAIERQSLLVEHAGQAGAGELTDRLEVDLQAYREQRLPEQVWRLDQPMFQPLAVDPGVLMRYYPAARPF